MGKFDDYVGEFTLKVGGVDLLFKDFTVKDKAFFVKFKDDSEKISGHLLEILKRENPTDDPKKIEMFLIDHSEDLLFAFYHKFGWMKDEQYKVYLEGGAAALGFMMAAKNGP